MIGRGLAADLRHAVRLYAKTPLASAVAVLVLAVAMAFVSAFLSLFSDLALKPLAGFARSGQLITVGQTDGVRFLPLSLALIESIDEEAGNVESITGVLAAPQFLESEGQGLVQTEVVTRRFFSDLGPALELGRGFDDDDHRAEAEPVVVLSHDFWQRRFGGDPRAVGQTIDVHGPPFVLATQGGRANAGEQSQTYRIVGVMAAPVAGTFATDVDLVMPYEQWAPAVFAGVGDAYRRFGMLRGLVRPADGASAESIRSELNGRYADSAEEFGLARSMRFDAQRGAVSDIRAHRDAIRQVALFTAGSALTALVAACTVSLFLLSRAPGRQRELATRMAVGAPLRRLGRQLASEAALLVVAATLLGILASVWLATVLRELPFLQAASWRSVSPLDWRVLGLTGATMLILTALVSVAPIAGLKKLGIAAGTRAVAARAGWGQRLAGTLQLAAAGALAGAALAFGWHLTLLVASDHGFDPENVTLIAVNPPAGAGFPFGAPDLDAILVERERRRAIIGALPGVESVGFGSRLPGRAAMQMITSVVPPEGPDEPINATLVSADPSYFDVLGMTLRGRTLDPTDREGIVVNETLAERLFGRTDVVGETLQTPSPGGLTGATIVGVVGDAPFTNPSEDVEPTMFRLVAGFSALDVILVRGAASPAELRGLVEDAIERGDLAFEIGDVVSVEELWSRQLAPDSARTWLAAAAAGLVVVLAAFGFYGMQRYLVAAGRREYAIRAAVGGGPRALGRLVLARAVALGAPGVAFGAALAFVAAAALKGGLVAETVAPGAVALAVALGMLALVLAASVGPAAQTRRMKAAPVLREE